MVLESNAAGLDALARSGRLHFGFGISQLFEQSLRSIVFNPQFHPSFSSLDFL